MSPFRLLSTGALLIGWLWMPFIPAQDYPAGNWANDAPGVKHRIDLKALPEPYASDSARNPPQVVDPPDGAAVSVPAGFSAEEVASGFVNPRYLELAPNGDVFLTESKIGKVLVLRDGDGDGTFELRETFVEGLDRPFGLAFFPPGNPEPGYLYVAETDGVVRFPYRSGATEPQGGAEEIAKFSGGGHLEGGGHWTRDIVFSKEGDRLFASVGSKTNVDEENLDVEHERARIFVMKPDGSEMGVFATGLRNPVGLAIHPETGDLWASVNERDGLGDNLVPDYITRVQEDGFYGWPWYYMPGILDPRHRESRQERRKDEVLTPDVPVQAHSASLNLVVYDGEMFPEEFRGDIFAAFHGSWNREPRTGYKVIRIDLENGFPVEPGVYEDFLTGFVLPSGDVWGRPVGLAVAQDGALLLSEDGNNSLWRIAYDGER